jgi:hypothetical protein
MIANLMSQGYSQAQAQTMAQLGARQGAAGQAAAGMMQLGNLEQLTQQAGLDAQMQEFMRQQNISHCNSLALWCLLLAVSQRVTGRRPKQADPAFLAFSARLALLAKATAQCFRDKGQKRW